MNFKAEKQLIAAVLMAVATQMLPCKADADSFGSGKNAFTLDFVNMGYAGNVADALTGYGAVDYTYRIGMHEVTLGQFAKAYAASGNTIGSGNEGYWNDGIRTVGMGGPAAYVNWNEAAQFANWLSSGDANTGVYSFSGGLLVGINRSYRNGNGMAYVLPSEDEWYKAAYYKPVDNGSYSLYANGSDSAASLTHGTSSGWNYYNSGYVNESPDYMWETGFGGQEQNGTYDMMGNIWEWNESAFDGSTNNMIASRVYRGGSAVGSEYYLLSSTRSSAGIAVDGYSLGFRVAAIPEPSSVFLFSFGSGGLIFYRRAKQRQKENQKPTRRDFR